MNPKQDIYGRPLRTAVEAFGEQHADSRIGLEGGVWVARFMVRPDVYAQRFNGAFKPQVGYAALDRRGKVVANGTKRDTIALAKGFASAAEMEAAS